MEGSETEPGAEVKPTHRRRRPTVVVDTNVLLVAPQPYQIEELKALGPAHYVVPATVLSELDILRARSETRDKARAALHVLEGFVRRGAVSTAVSCGSTSTLRIATHREETPQPWLDMNLADDRILALCICLANKGNDVKLVTVEFALYARAAVARVEGLYLERFKESSTVLTRRERASFRLAWARLQAADSCWSICRRGLLFLRNPLVHRLTRGARESRQPPELASILAKFDALDGAWSDKTTLDTIMEGTLGIPAPPQVNYAVSLIDEPVPYSPVRPANLGFYQLPRKETAEEHALRIRAEEGRRKAWEDYNVDTVLSWLEVVREYVLDQVAEDLE